MLAELMFAEGLRSELDGDTLCHVCMTACVRSAALRGLCLTRSLS